MSDITQRIEDELIAGQIKGGPRSGFFAPAHRGRPGQQGGSQSAGGAGGAGGTIHRAGVTSARPGKTTEQVTREMATLKADLEKVATDVSVSMGIGGWEGGREDTHQDGALIMRQSRKGLPDAEPQQSLSFGRPLDRPAQEVIETQLVKNGIGGWTWANRNGKTTLIVQTVKAWDGNAENDLAAIQGLRDALNSLGANVTYAQDWATVEALWSGNYDDYIAKVPAGVRGAND